MMQRIMRGRSNATLGKVMRRKQPITVDLSKAPDKAKKVPKKKFLNNLA
jgi:hypothetical protein